ncbi:MAG: dihydrolipoyl dehydrogenase [Solirubrobacteraceae bacterium]|nr:dihydrolipoyl dehydrogenase [Solirubrobacteraceae bacterium]
MADQSFDLVVVGSGPGGYVSAIRAAQLGLKTAVIEKGDVGGRCLNVACIPAKAVLRSADVLSEIQEAGEFGINVGEPTVDFDKVSERRKSVISTLTGGVAGLLKKNKIEYIEGSASLNADGTLTVEGVGTIEGTKGVLLATGSVRRAIPGIEYGDKIIGTEEAWALPAIPQTLAVVGAGASGTEIASAYARLGSTVTLLEGLDRVLPSEDADISRVAARGFKKQGIEVLVKTFAENVREEGGKVVYSAGGEDRSADYLVIATGRAPDVEGLGLDVAGVELEDHLIKVDGWGRTSKEGIFAIGDLVAGPALAHKSMEEGIVCVEAIAGHDSKPLEHAFIPRATFCYPNVASFGYTEAQAKERGYDVQVGKVPYGAVGAPLVYGDRGGTVKIIVDKKYGEIIGGHVVGAKATELIQELVNARELEGGVQEVARIVHGHPTFSEAVVEAARAADGWLIHG